MEIFTKGAVVNTIYNPGVPSNLNSGIDATQPRFPVGLFEPNRNLIRSNLDRMSEKYFPLKR